MQRQSKQKKKGSALDHLLTVAIVIGLIVMGYPLVSQLYYRHISATIVTEFDAGVEELDLVEIDHRIDLAHAYNETLNTGLEDLHDPYTEEEKEAGKAEYARMLEVREQIGHIHIPKILLKAPIYAGTSELVLQKGVGHMEGTSLPVGGNNTHTVLTAHRGLPTARLFTDLNRLEVGDRFYIKNIQETLAYQIAEIQVIEPHDYTDLMTVPGHDYATLLTCTPYMINSHRLVLRGHRIPYIEAQEEKDIKENNTSTMYKYLFYITLAILIFVLFSQEKSKRKERKEKRDSAAKG
ncbi:MAG: class C sortase [Eubacteriaceae bacterium]|jgi:sortase A|nr:class C sortase [Eubacteriaceae bacterium]